MSDNEDTEEQAAAAPAAALPEIKQIVGSLLFSSHVPLSVKQIRNVFRRAAEEDEDGVGPASFAGIGEEDVQEALDELRDDLAARRTGITIAEVSTGLRLQNDKSCGPWIRQLLEKGRVSRLSKPALETLAIIAYRQPCTRADVEAIRGVAVDGMVRNLLEMQLVKVVGRSELPGRPWLFGTTQLFMEHFGLKDIDDLPGIQELKRQAIAEPAKRPRQQDLLKAGAPRGEEADGAEPDEDEEADEEAADANEGPSEEEE